MTAESDFLLPPTVSRRAWLQASFASAAGLALTPPETLASPQPALQNSAPPLTPLNRFPRMVQEYFVKKVRDIEAASLKRKAALKTKADAEAYVLDVKRRIRASFGPLPEKTPLNARITGTLERDAYKIEKVIFESRPGFLVTANLYLPKGRKHPLPAVVGTCGHDEHGKAGMTYQSFAQGLARQGYVVLIFDPIGQGERLQYPNEQLKSRIGNGVNEHLYAGNQQVLVGENFAAWRAWDGIRALDYLLTRPEVDPRHVGITGNSGGGTMTTWLCGLEQRWTMAAPGCFVTTFRRNLENELPQDIEQYVPKALAAGLDHDDFLAALAPKPVIILAKEKDYFDVRAAEETFARLQRLYRLLGKPDNIALQIGNSYHGFTQENREAMYRWFNRATGQTGPAIEPKLELEKPEDLLCMPHGQVAELKSRTMFSFTAEIAQELSASRKTKSGTLLSSALMKVLRLESHITAPDARILRRLNKRGYPKPEFVNYAVETEPGIHALVTRLADEPLYSRPPRGQQSAVLYVAHQSSDDELRNEPLIRELLAAETNAAFYTCDVRGIGESQPDTCGEDQFLKPYGSDYFYAGHSLMLDRSYLAQRAYDVMRVIEWLGSYGHTEIHLAGKGWGALPATLAAVLSEHVKQVTLKNALTSFTELATSEYYQWPLALLPMNVLSWFDLPDCYRELASKNLKLIEPWNALSQTP